MKPSDDLKKTFPIYTKKDAETIPEIMKLTGLSDATVRRHAKRMVDEGIWKEVLVKRNKGLINAYVKVK